jgi:hypothetical protein
MYQAFAESTSARRLRDSAGAIFLFDHDLSEPKVRDHGLERDELSLNRKGIPEGEQI